MRQGDYRISCANIKVVIQGNSIKKGVITVTNREAYERDCEELEQYRAIGTVEECRKAVEKQKRRCDSAEKCADGKCVGYGKSEMDDEPCEMCKRCKSYTGFEESEEE